MAALIKTEIDSLKKDILSLGVAVRENLANAMKALFRRDGDLALKVKEGDRDIDRVEITIEEKCLKMLALHQPVARDLRFVVTVLKINNDLERIGDLAAKIANKVLLLGEDKNDIVIPADFNVMLEKTMWMLGSSLDALVHEDAALAYKVRDTDEEVNEAKRRIRNQIEKRISNQIDQGVRLAKLMSVSRSLERIADHATNIAEDVIYLLQGKIIRHN